MLGRSVVSLYKAPLSEAPALVEAHGCGILRVHGEEGLGADMVEFSEKRLKEDGADPLPASKLFDKGLVHAVLARGSGKGRDRAYDAIAVLRAVDQTVLDPKAPGVLPVRDELRLGILESGTAVQVGDGKEITHRGLTDLHTHLARSGSAL